MDGERARVWPASEIVVKRRDELHGYERNSRTHSADQVSQIVASMEEWGWTNPVLIDDAGMVIAGHGRLMAAAKLGIDEVPCMVASGWSEEQKRAYVIADNKLAENASWDQQLLSEEMGQLADLGFDLGTIGFDEAELAEMLKQTTAGLTDPNEAPEVEAVAVSRLDDTWLLGKHRLRCGDSTNASNVAALLAGKRPHLMVTDPPYGVNYDPSWRAKFAKSKVASGKVLNDDRADWTEAWRLFPGHVAYVWHGALHNVDVSESLQGAGFAIRSQIVWVKTRAPISRGNYHWQHEPAFYAEKESGEEAQEDAGPEGFSVDHGQASYVVRVSNRADWRGGRKQTTVWFIEHLKNDTGHGTQKPVECMRRPILNNSLPGDAIYEPFCGSGTTLIAGEMEDRPVYAMELNPLYIDVIVRRWQDFVGAEAILEATGQTFDKVEAERCGSSE